MHNDCQELTDFTEDIDLREISSTGATGGEFAQRVDVLDAGEGSLVVVTGAGKKRTLSVSNGEQLELVLREILKPTDLAKLRVFW